MVKETSNMPLGLKMYYRNSRYKLKLLRIVERHQLELSFHGSGESIVWIVKGSNLTFFIKEQIQDMK